MVKETAYIIDTDSDFINRLKKLLEEEYIISVFSDPQKAFDLILKKKPDIVITELLFPSLDGINFIASLKENCVESPIVVATKLPVSQKFAKIFEISDCFNKSIADEEIYERIKKSSGWKKRKVSPPLLPIITEGKIGEAIKQILDEIYEEKRTLCYQYLGKKDFLRAIEIVAFLRRVYPTDIRTQGLIREVLFAPQAISQKEGQTSFEVEPQKVNALLRRCALAHEANDIKKMLECGKALLKAEDVKNGIKVLREIVVFSEENPYLAEQVIIKEIKPKIVPWDVLAVLTIMVSMLFKPYIFASLAVVFSCCSLISKSKKIPQFVIPIAAVVVFLRLANVPTLSTKFERYLARKAQERMLYVTPKFFYTNEGTLKIRYRVPKSTSVLIKIKSASQKKTLIDNPTHEAGVFEVEWNGKDENGNYFRSDLNVIFKCGAATYQEKVYAGLR